MYYTWKNTPYGIIRVSCKGLYDFVAEAVRARLRLYSITLEPSGKKEHTNLTLVFSDEDIPPEMKRKAEDHISSVMKPLGLKASIVWASPERGIMSAIQNPYVWAGLASCIAVVVTAGFAGFFWTLFWGGAAWFVIRGAKFIAGRFRSAEYGG
ncbi:MAG: hypothetical protein IJP86_07065 [Synergistaceae bacterium]|nr:hypothetical protein [Synergistaceae bacterium]